MVPLCLNRVELVSYVRELKMAANAYNKHLKWLTSGMYMCRWTVHVVQPC